MSDDEQNVSNEGEKDETNQENTETETDPAPATEADDSSEKTTDETIKPKWKLFGLSNKMIVIIAATVIISVIIIIVIIIIVTSLVKEKDSELDLDLKKSIAKVKAKCEEYAQLACTGESEKPQSDKLNRIWHGRDASPDILPYMVYFVVSHDSAGNMNECTGTLISERFVLTAAHCIIKRGPDSIIHGFLAAQFKPHPRSKQTVIYVQFDKTYIHEKYNGTNGTINKEADIALMESLQKVSLSASVRPICLNTKLENTAGDFISAGYGLIEDHKESDRLKMVEIRIDGEVQKKCQKELTEARRNYDDFTKKMICAAHPTEKKGGDAGDSGGPLMYRMKHKCPIHEEIAVLSQSNDYKLYEPPVLLLYVKIEPYISWIANIVWPDPKPNSSNKMNPT